MILDRDGSVRWVVSLPKRHCSDPVGRIRAWSKLLVHHYAREWHAVPDRNGPEGVAKYESRLANVLRYHWWRHCEDGFKPLSCIIEKIQDGELAYGRFHSDILREISLVEGVCQMDQAATEQFLDEFSGDIATAARRAGGVRAQQDLEGFEAELMIPQDDNTPPKLALFAGHTPLRNWLKRVVYNQWCSRLRRQRKLQVNVKLHDLNSIQGPCESAEAFECLNVLKPVFEQSAEVLDPDSALMLRMNLLDGVPRQQLARLWGVHKSTITRTCQRNCRQIADRFWQLVENYGRQEEYEDCIHWISTVSPQTWSMLGNYLAESIRRCER